MIHSYAVRPVVHGLALLCLFGIGNGPIRAQVPAEVEDLSWCPASKDCLGWDTVVGTDLYHVYRGDGTALPGLLDATPDACAFDSFSGTSTGPVVGDPPPGALFWFLVTAANAEGEGSPGLATEGPRVLDPTGACGSNPPLVINEVDYDQVGTDVAEFVEIHNPGPTDRDLDGVVLVLVNGTSSSEYDRIELSAAAATLPAGGYLVVGSPAVVAALPGGTLTVAFGSNTNNLQNGAPDGLALFDTTAAALLDALSYEGSITAAQFDGEPGTFNLVEGNPTAIVDSNSVAGSLTRFPDGADTDDAATDWSFNNLPSPGTSNPIP